MRHAPRCGARSLCAGATVLSGARLTTSRTTAAGDRLPVNGQPAAVVLLPMQVKDQFRLLVLAIIRQAVFDARIGAPDAIEFLRSDDARAGRSRRLSLLAAAFAGAASD